MSAATAEQQQFENILRRNVAVPVATGVVSALLFIAVVLFLLGALRDVEESQRVLASSGQLARISAEGRASMRGFVITGDQRFLDTFDAAVPQFRAELEHLKTILVQAPSQRVRLDKISELYTQWLAFAKETAVLHSQNPAAAAQRVIAGEGERLGTAMRTEFSALDEAERRTLSEHNAAANTNAIALTVGYVIVILALKGFLAFRARRDLTTLSQRYTTALGQQAEHSNYLQAQGWLREGQSQLGQVLAGRQDLHAVGRRTLEFLSGYLGSVVGAMYALEDDGKLRRIAAYGLSQQQREQREEVAPGQNLVAEVAAAGRPLRLERVPADYLHVESAVSGGTTASVQIVPLTHEGQVNGVLELGLMRDVVPRDAELLERIAELVGNSVEGARFRQRLQLALAETQHLNEELQVQQEELRTANEELEEQSKALKESQAHLENQQAELEQTNEQLSGLAQQLADQRDALQQAQGELEQRADEVERASRYKSDFLANMSHELRTPLNSTLILAKLLADNAQGNLDAEQVKFAESIYSSGNDLLNLINDILDISKVEAGKLEIRPEVTPVTPLAEGLRSMFEPLAGNKGLTLQVQFEPGLPDTIYTDRQRVEQILRNLMSNALKFTEKGRVALTVRPTGDGGVSLEVQDTGIGIDPAQHEAIFEAFQQADGTISRKYGGTGLGLSISRDLARLLGGSIEVRSQRGAGSTFALTLPANYTPAAERASAAEPAVQRSSLSPPPAPTPAPTLAPPRKTAAPTFPDDRQQAREQRRSVLVIEDDASFARILFDLAHELGYHCVVAHQAEEGWQLAEQLQPDAVLLDMRLPDGSGLSVLQRLKEHPGTRHIPVHVISVEDLAETALQMGAVGYMLKPANRDQLQEVFARVESKLSQKVKRVLLVEDDARQRESVRALIADTDVEIVTAAEGATALKALAESVFDCMIIDLKLPDMSGQELLRRMAAGESRSFPPVIVYTGRNLTRDEEAELLRYSRSIIIKGARSPERLLDEVTLFLHKVETQLSSERQRMLRVARNRDRVFEGRRILVVDDDVRNIFALTSALEHKGAVVEVARNGVEALQKLDALPDVDLVLMDIMMPEMDGYTAMGHIRRDPRWQKLPVIAVTAKAMREDQERCLKAGANDYLSKPIDLERLFSLMRVWMPKLERV
jgi:CheY-like chemotaxis protein/CHASE3 domain sensor protein